MKIISGDRTDQFTADKSIKFFESDTCDSGDATYAAEDAQGISHDDILDSAQNETGADQVAAFVAILTGDSNQSETPKVYSGNDVTTPNGKTYRDGIVSIPGGQFEMGSVGDNSDEHKSDGTTMIVTLSGFKLSKSEVTVGQYKAHLAATGDTQYSSLPDFKENQKGDRFPVVGLTYDEKIAFCEYYGGTLPTAAQIEYATKGPSHTDVCGTPFDKAAFWRNGFRTTAEVCGSNNERANGYGVCDLTANVSETTRDQYDPVFYNRMPPVNPSNPLTDSNQQQVEIRNGSWFDGEWSFRPAYRNSVDANYRYFFLGFRCAWSQDSQ